MKKEINSMKMKRDKNSFCKPFSIVLEKKVLEYVYCNFSVYCNTVCISVLYRNFDTKLNRMVYLN